MLKKFAYMGVAGTVLTATILVAAPTASAATTRDGRCQAGEFCYYYGSNNTGSLSDFGRSVSNYGAAQPKCYEFKSTGRGRNSCIKNNAASVWNRSRSIVRVYYNSGFAGAHQDIAPGYKGNLNPRLRNENASHQFRNRESLFDDPTVDVRGVEDTRARGGYSGSTAWAEAVIGSDRIYRVAVRCDVRFRRDYWAYGNVVAYRGVSRADCGGGHRAYDGIVQWRFPDGTTTWTGADGL